MCLFSQPPGDEFQFPDLFKEKRPSTEIDRLLDQAQQAELQPSKEDQEEDAKHKSLEASTSAEKGATTKASDDKKPSNSGISGLPQWFS